jgi:hypothetical protein
LPYLPSVDPSDNVFSFILYLGAAWTSAVLKLGLVADVAIWAWYMQLDRALRLQQLFQAVIRRYYEDR